MPTSPSRKKKTMTSSANESIEWRKFNDPFKIQMPTLDAWEIVQGATLPGFERVCMDEPKVFRVVNVLCVEWITQSKDSETVPWVLVCHEDPKNSSKQQRSGCNQYIQYIGVKAPKVGTSWQPQKGIASCKMKRPTSLNPIAEGPTAWISQLSSSTPIIFFRTPMDQQAFVKSGVDTKIENSPGPSCSSVRLHEPMEAKQCPRPQEDFPCCCQGTIPWKPGVHQLALAEPSRT